MPGIHLVSDVHLKDGEPDTWEAFFDYLENTAASSDGLYLLGDIFDAWIGDDDDRKLAVEARKKLAKLVGSGCPVYFVFGNHDFLVGKRFAKETGVRLLGESATIEACRKKILLMHGDTLCTGDVDYLRARKKILRSHYLFYARLLSRKTRMQRAAQMLEGRDPIGFLAKDLKVDDDLSSRLLNESGAKVLVHGHTHVPGSFELPCGRTRWSLPNWKPGERAGWLVCEEGGFVRGGSWGD